jgi:hypothetical protein
MHTLFSIFFADGSTVSNIDVSIYDYLIEVGTSNSLSSLSNSDSSLLDNEDDLSLFFYTT